MPIPVSRTRTTASSPSFSTVSPMFPPRSMYLAALFKQIGQDLGQPGRVAFEPQGFGRLGNSQAVPAAFDVRAGDLDGIGDHVRQLDALRLEIDLATADTGDIQQVIDQSGQMLDLAFDDIPGPLEVNVGRAEVLQDLEGIRDRGQGVAEFVRQSARNSSFW